MASDGDSFALLNSWRTVLRARGLAEKTIHDYTLGVWRLAAHHDFSVALLDMDEQHVAVFLSSLSEHSTARHQYAKGIKSFFRWVQRRGWIFETPVSEDILPRPPVKPRKQRFERDEITRLLIAAAWRDERRAWAILACLTLGLRRREFVGLLWSDVQWDLGRVHVRAAIAKGRKERFVAMAPWAREALLELQRIAAGSPRVVAIQPNTFNNWVHEAATDCGFPPGRKQRAHTLRATFASWLLDDGVPVHVVRDLMGHESIATTNDYAAIGDEAGAIAVAPTFGGLRATSTVR
jgi:integrase